MRVCGGGLRRVRGGAADLHCGAADARAQERMDHGEQSRVAASTPTWWCTCTFMRRIPKPCQAGDARGAVVALGRAAGLHCCRARANTLRVRTAQSIDRVWPQQYRYGTWH